jgi:hypothetical protein
MAVINLQDLIKVGMQYKYSISQWYLIFKKPSDPKQKRQSVCFCYEGYSFLQEILSQAYSHVASLSTRFRGDFASLLHRASWNHTCK